MASPGSTQLVRVYIPDAKTQKCIVLNTSDTVWAAKQVILDKVYKELPNDPLNYSLYLPASGRGKLGKFMDDGLQLSNYALKGTVPKLEMQYKRRDYSKHVSMTEKAIVKANSKASQRKLVEYVQSSAYKKIDKILEAGLDPNFVTEDGNTPLGLACGRNRSVQCIQSLLSGGAHIDFRGKDGLTPMHRAAIGGNAMAINSLLSYGASPNYRDAKGLSPLYHAAIMGDDTGGCITLLRNKAELGIKDQGGWSELHHTSKYGHVQHAELFIRYGADINDQNLVGNTPLHVAASHGQEDCALKLLKRGADKTFTNFSGQSPSQVAILCGHHQLATEISEFPADQIELLTIPPDYNENARDFAPKLFMQKQVSETCPIRPSAELLVGTLTQEWEDEDIPETQLTPTIRKESTTVRPGSASSRSSSARLAADSGTGDTESVSSIELGSTHSGSIGAPGTPGPSTPTFRRPSFQQQRERLYRAGPGKYVSIQDMDPQQSGDISLRKGMPVEVTYIGKGGYWEGRAGNEEGWFPRLAIKEMGEEQFDYQPKNSPPAKKRIAESKMHQEKSSSNRKSTNIREVVIKRSNRGYGFAMRGVRATKAMQFHPTPEVPALQYVGSIEEDGAAVEAGLNAGDFILEVNGHNVTHSTHDEVVAIVRKSSDSLRIKVITPLIKPKSVSQQIKGRMTPVATPEATRKDPAIPEKQPIVFKESSDTASISSDKETVIGGTILRTESPMFSSVEPSGWDSSQDDDFSKQKAPGFYSHHIPVIQSSSQGSPTFKSFPISPPSAPLSTDVAKSQTLPLLPAKDYPKLDDYATSSSEDEDDNSSAFALALQREKQKMNRKSLVGKPRERSNTLPEKDSPLVVRRMAPQQTDNEPGMSPMQEQILQASIARNERANTNQLRMKALSKTEEDRKLPKNPLAKAMSLKIDSVMFDSDGFDSGDEFSSSPTPSRSYLKSRPLANKPPPPTTKPKPQRRQTDTSIECTTIPTSSPVIGDKIRPPPVLAKPSPELRNKVHTRVPSEDFELPPPLPAVEHRPSSFVDVAPPPAFTLDGAEEGESSTDDCLPPPLPDTSPPPTLAPAPMFIFPTTSTPKELSPSPSVTPIPPVNDGGQLPSPSRVNDGGQLPSPSRVNDGGQLPIPSRVNDGGQLPSPSHANDGGLLPSPSRVNDGGLLPSPSRVNDGSLLPSPISSPTSRANILDISGSVVPPPQFDPRPWSPTQSDLSDIPPSPPEQPPPSLDNSPESFPGTHSPPPRPPLPDYSLPNTPQKHTLLEAPIEHNQQQVTESSVSPETPHKPEDGFQKSKDLIHDQSSDLLMTSYHNKTVLDWSMDDVCEWLTDMNLREHASSFKDNEIVGEHLVDLSKEDLKELGVKKLGHQKTILSKLNALLQ